MSLRIDEPRPGSAWVLVGVASATLWITEQLLAPVMAAQAAMFAFSLWRREDPHPLQRGPIFLNLVMLGITATTIAVALRGNPSTISLAHFAALTQGLQLLDVRPRKSEFLLVALALFQVLLAANLTDSVLFPPLLVVFTVSVTWTLMVHTLRTEAVAAGEARAVDTAITPNLARSTAVVTLGAVALAMVFFVSLPRLRTSMVTAGMRGSQALSGFSDNVELGAIGNIRKDPRIVLRVETLEGDAGAPGDAYWRGLAFDTFDGRRWSISPLPDRSPRRPIPSPPRFGVDIAGGPNVEPRARLVQRIIREPVTSGVLFGTGEARRIEGAINHVEVDRNGGLYTPTQVEDRVQYTVWTTPPAARDAALADDRFAVPDDRVQGGSGDRYLALPELDPRIHEVAKRATEAATSDAERAHDLERWLRENGTYTDSPGVLASDELRTPIEAFLLEGLSGHCEYFASSMVVLARSVGIPARLVNGFAGGRRNDLGGFVSVSRADAHAWVEIHFERAGWVRYDPTPPDLRMREAAVGLGERFAELTDALETWWFRRVVEFDSADQIAALKSALGAWRALKSSTESPNGSDDADGSGSIWDALAAWRGELRTRPSPVALALLVAATLVAAAGIFRLRAANEDVPLAYRRALRLLARRGHVRRPEQAARDFARSLAVATRPLDPLAQQAFERLTEAYLAERFGGHRNETGHDAPSARALTAFERALTGRSPS